MNNVIKILTDWTSGHPERAWYISSYHRVNLDGSDIRISLSIYDLLTGISLLNVAKIISPADFNLIDLIAANLVDDIQSRNSH